MVYHEVNPFTFNWWQVVFAVEIIVWIIIGQLRYRLEDSKSAVVERIGNSAIVWLNVISSIVFGICFTFESWRGVLQWLENGLISDVAAWAVILLPIAIVVIVMVNALLTGMIGWLSGQVKYAKLSAITRKNRRKTMQRKDDLFTRWSS